MIPSSLVPFPTPEAVGRFVLAMFQGGLNLGRVIVEAVFVFMESLGQGLV